MELGLLIGHVKTKLAEYKKLLVKPHTSQGEAYYHNLEAQLSFFDFEEVIKSLEKLDPKIEATKEHVESITKFFETRWNTLLKNTDAMYLIDTLNPMNRCCVIIAKYLAEQTDLVSPRNFLSLLMPTVISWYNERSHHDLSMRFMHNFILNDSNTRPIELDYLIEKLDRRNRLILSHVVDGKEVELTTNESARVYEHSKAVTNYYKAFMCDKPEKDALVKNTRNVLITSLRDKDYAGQRAESSYGYEGRHQLMSNLLLRANNLFQTREQLFDYMAAKVDRKNWKSFIAKLTNDTTYLNLFMVDGKELGESLEIITNSKDTFIESSIYDRAVFFCLIEAYWRDRKEKPEFTSMVSGRLFGWPKTDKQSAKDMMQSVLAEDGKSFPDIVEASNHSDVRVAGAMADGSLGVIYQRMQAILAENTKGGSNDLRKAVLN
jgi:hypothetical protein